MKKNIGVGNVCEAAALCVSVAKFALPKKFWHTSLTKNFVKKNIGVGNVCEAAALCVAVVKFALPKTKFDEVTIALAWN